MKYFLILLLTSACFAQALPTQNPDKVTVKGRVVSHSWRGGRIFVPSSQLRSLLNLQFEMPTVDLMEALEKKGGYVTTFENGHFEAKRDRSLYSQGVDPSQARAHNRREVQKSARDKAARQRAEANQPKLSHKVQRFVAETGFVRAYIRVTNVGGSASPAMTMIADFTDGYGKAFARDTTVISPLPPGGYQDVEVFSMIRDRETIANGVIRTVNNEKVNVKFVGL